MGKIKDDQSCERKNQTNWTINQTKNFDFTIFCLNSEGENGIFSKDPGPELKYLFDIFLLFSLNIFIS